MLKHIMFFYVFGGRAFKRGRSKHRASRNCNFLPIAFLSVRSYSLENPQSMAGGKKKILQRWIGLLIPIRNLGLPHSHQNCWSSPVPQSLPKYAPARFALKWPELHNKLSNFIDLPRRRHFLVFWLGQLGPSGCDRCVSCCRLGAHIVLFSPLGPHLEG